MAIGHYVQATSQLHNAVHVPTWYNTHTHKAREHHTRIGQVRSIKQPPNWTERMRVHQKGYRYWYALSLVSGNASSWSRTWQPRREGNRSRNPIFLMPTYTCKFLWFCGKWTEENMLTYAKWRLVSADLGIKFSMEMHYRQSGLLSEGRLRRYDELHNADLAGVYYKVFHIWFDYRASR